MQVCGTSGGCPAFCDCAGSAVGSSCGALVAVGDSACTPGGACPSSSIKCGVVFQTVDVAVVDCPVALNGRYVQVTMPGRTNYLNLREVPASAQ